mgnify:CR=1 FL=1
MRRLRVSSPGAVMVRFCRRRPSFTRAVLLGIALAQVACAAGPQRVALSPAPTFRPRQQVEVWRQGKATTLHAVKIAGDGLSGIPYWRPIDCDTCRISVDLGTVDSLRTVEGEKSAIIVATLPIVALAVVLLTWRATEGD